MKSTGIVRGIDSLGRIVLPKELRSLHWEMQIKGAWGIPQQAFCNAK